MQEKAKLRAHLKMVRSSLSAGEVKIKSHAIAYKLMALFDWTDIKNVHIYSSIPAWNEIDTGPIIEGLKKRWPHVEIINPSTDKDQPLPDRKFDLIIVPTLGFDSHNHRLGLGGGYYDRFLATQQQAQKIGIAYQSSFIAKGLPHEPHDISLDRIITEEGIIDKL
jgi:5-formyltetrahydrofolate cyclo-ligase